MNLVLNEKVYERYQCAKEAPCKELSVFNSLWVVWTESEAPHRPRQRGDQVRYHEDIMPVMVVC